MSESTIDGGVITVAVAATCVPLELANRTRGASHAADFPAGARMFAGSGRSASGQHLDMTVFGSTTNQVVRQATCPVLTLRG